jgi:predicted enzyme related to lactoylglutathione lyase
MSAEFVESHCNFGQYRDWLSWYHSSRKPNGEADVVNSCGRFVWYELLTSDVEGAKEFYVKVMGWSARDLSSPGVTYVLFTVGETVVAGLMQLWGGARTMGTTPHWVGYVGVDDVDAAADRVERRGGAVSVPPTDISNVSRFSVFVDPQAAALGVLKWMRSVDGQPADMGARGCVGWHELIATDREKALAFYSGLFGWQHADADVSTLGTYQLFSAGGETIGGMVTGPATMPALWLYYFNVGDIDAAAKRVTVRGGRIFGDPLELRGGSWVIQCADPQGAAFALEGKRGSSPVGYFKRVDRAILPARETGKGPVDIGSSA